MKYAPTIGNRDPLHLKNERSTITFTIPEGFAAINQLIGECLFFLFYFDATYVEDSSVGGISQIYKTVLPSTYYMILLNIRPTFKDNNLSILTSAKMQVIFFFAALLACAMALPADEQSSKGLNKVEMTNHPRELEADIS